MSVIGSLASVLGKLDKVMSSAQAGASTVNRSLQSAGRRLRSTARAGGTYGPTTKKVAQFLRAGSLPTKLSKLQGGARRLGRGFSGGGKGGGGINFGSSMSKVGTLAMDAASGNVPKLAFDTAMMAITNGIGHAQNSAALAGKALGSERIGAVGGSAMRMGAEGVEQATDPLGLGYGKIASAPIKFGAALVESIDKLQDFSHSLHDSNMKFAEFSGAMAGVKARQDVRDIYLSRERGERRAGSAETLAGSMNRLDKAKAPLEDAFANLKAELMPLIIEPVVAILQGVNFILEKLPEPKDTVKAAAFAASAATGGLSVAAWMLAQRRGGATTNLNAQFGEAGGLQDYGLPPRGTR